MARREPGRHLETWKHPKNGVEVEIRFDPGAGTFWAYYGEDRISSKVLQDVRDRLRKIVDERMDIKWIALMKVSSTAKIDSNVHRREGRGGYSIESAEFADQADEGKSEIELHYQRYWVAWVGAKWMRCDDWDAPEDGSYSRIERARDWNAMSSAGKDVTFPHTRKLERYYDQGEETYLPYSQALWDALLVVSGKMAELAERLETLLSTDEGRNRLETAMTGLLLPAPVEDDEA